MNSKKIILLVVGTIAIFFAGLYAPALMNKTTIFNIGNNAEWYAVQTINGIEYYGHIDTVSDASIKLDDVYYIETLKAPEPPISKSVNYQIQPSAPKEIYNLVHKGEGSTAPEANTLYLNRSTVISWEKLASDSQIVALIEKSKNKDK